MGSWVKTSTPAPAFPSQTASADKKTKMDAIRKKMQSLKAETEQLYATIASFEEATREASARADRADCDIRDLGKKVQNLEMGYDETNDKLTKATESLEEADKQYKEVEADVAALTRRIMLMEEEDKKAADTLCNTVTKLAITSKNADLIPNVQKTAVMVDLYWKCYAYGDELKPHVEFLDGIMLSSTRDIAPSCLENVDELIERQEKSLSQLDAKRNIVTDLIAKGKVILQNPDKPKFLEANVKRIQDGWEDTKQKAQDRLQLLTETKSAFIGYAEDNETVAREFESAEEEIKKVKKIFNLEAANADLKKRQDILKRSDETVANLFSSINSNYKTMCITIPEDKKKVL